MITEMNVVADFKNTTSCFNLGADSFNETSEIMVMLK